MSARLQAILALPVILLAGGAMAWAGSQGSAVAFGVPLFGLCAVLSFAINWVVFVHSYAQQTEKYFDLTGSLTYLTLVVLGVLLGNGHPRSLLIALLVATWAIRLGSFLFLRIRADGSDDRFDDIKPDFARLLMAWTLQGLWVLLTLACGLAAITTEVTTPLGLFAALGALMWVAGFAIEVIADWQKRVFRNDESRDKDFITHGLWAWSRHPNYFGEILLWAGIAVIALPTLAGWQYAALISPVFVYLLLTRISGVPMLERKAKKRWGDDPEYQAYKQRTPVLFPKPPAAQST